MFGFVRPDKAELKVRDYELYRAVYCGLCHSLKKRCGAAGRFIINYDFTFLAMLLSHAETGCSLCVKKCVVSPLKGRKACIATAPDGGSAILEACADMSVILAWWKLKDGMRDEAFFKAAACRIGAAFLRRGYKKAAAALPGFADNCRKRIEELELLERAGCSALDDVSDKFALILAGAAEAAGTENERRILSQLLYQLGKLIYMLDALCDYDDDLRAGRYNPLRTKYGSRPDRSALEPQLSHILGFITSAYELLDGGAFSPVLENIMYLGLPSVVSMTLEGRYTQKLRKRREPGL